MFRVGVLTSLKNNTPNQEIAPNMPCENIGSSDK